MVTNVASQGNCFTFNSQYNKKDSFMYDSMEKGYHDTGKRRRSSLTGPRFGLNLILTLDQLVYMKGEITKKVFGQQFTSIF